MKKLPRSWLLFIAVLLIGGLSALGWWRWSAAPQPQVADGILTPDASQSVDASSAAISAQLNFTFTVPAGWNVQAWQRDTLIASSQPVSQQMPRLRESIDRLLAAFRTDSQVLLLQAEQAEVQSSLFLLLAMPAHGVRLEQIASVFASETSLDRVMDPELRADGQPILRIRGEQLTGLDSRASHPQQVVMLNHFRKGELIVIVEIQTSEPIGNLPSSTILEEIVRSIELQ